jgi:DNA-binding NtrC family response regulator
MTAAAVDAVMMPRFDRPPRGETTRASIFEAVPTSIRAWGAGFAPPASPIEEVRATAARVARSNISVLLLGETGVGKEVFARTIHQGSRRANRPFVAINCGGLSETLLDSELFGHERHSFTGAATAKTGLFEAADGGTLFLDEIGEMPLEMQTKLLRVLETREVRPLGSLRSRTVDVRLLAATNLDIESAAEKGLFRPDLMYRLNAVTLTIPPLRDRKDELPQLVEAFLAQVSIDEGVRLPAVSREAMECLHQHRWPGNIRELRNVVERAVLLCDGPAILPEHLRLDARPVQDRPIPLHRYTDEKIRILAALDACGRNQGRAAKLLGISRRKLISRLDHFKIPRPIKEYVADASEPGSSRPGFAAEPGAPKSAYA